MAMNFRKRSTLDEPEINLIPFIDVLLVILIFLMLSTTYSKFTELQLRLPVSTALNGPGERNGSGCTPRGLHQVRAKIGDGLPNAAVLRGRRWTGWSGRGGPMGPGPACTRLRISSSLTQPTFRAFRGWA